MKRFTTLFALALLAALPLAAAQADPDPAGAKTETKEYRLTGFNQINVSSIYHVELSRSGKFFVKVEAPDFIMPYLDVTTEGGKLKLGMKEMPKDIRLKLETNGRNEVRAFVSMPSLTGLNMSGAANLEAQGGIFPAGKEFELKMSGATQLKGLSVEAREAEIECNGAAKFNLKGSFTEMEMELSGAASGSLDNGIKANALKAAEVKMSGAAKLTLTCRAQKMEVEASGAANLEWSGYATDLFLNGSGAAKINAAGAPADKADVRLSGAAKATIGVEKELSVNLSGASTCHYKAGSAFHIANQSISRGAALKQL